MRAKPKKPNKAKLKKHPGGDPAPKKPSKNTTKDTEAENTKIPDEIQQQKFGLLLFFGLGSPLGLFVFLVLLFLVSLVWDFLCGFVYSFGLGFFVLFGFFGFALAPGILVSLVLC